jgi:hypothetical protein
MAGTETNWSGGGTMTGAVAAVAEFGQPDGDTGNGPEDLDRVAAVRAGCLRGRVEAECLLGASDARGLRAVVR